MRRFFSLATTPSFAADVWFYEWRDPASFATPSRPTAPSEGRHWILTEFDGEPYANQLAAIRDARGFEKASLLFKLPVSPALADEYVSLARALGGRGIGLQLKFMDSLPNAGEAAILKKACDEGARVVFISNSIPGPDETAALLSLRGCVTLDLALGRYPRYDEINALKKLEGVPLAFVNDYFPQYAHMDVLNIIGLPVDLHVTDGTPSTADLVYLNGVKSLKSFSYELKVMPDASHYAQLGKFNRKDGARKLTLRWAFSSPRDSDVEAWLALQPDRVQLDSVSYETHAAKLRGLDGEIIVETFPLRTAAIDVMDRMAFSPQD